MLCVGPAFDRDTQNRLRFSHGDPEVALGVLHDPGPFPVLAAAGAVAPREPLHGLVPPHAPVALEEGLLVFHVEASGELVGQFLKAMLSVSLLVGCGGKTIEVKHSMQCLSWVMKIRNAEDIVLRLLRSLYCV